MHAPSNRTIAPGVHIPRPSSALSRTSAAQSHHYHMLRATVCHPCGMLPKRKKEKTNSHSVTCLRTVPFLRSLLASIPRSHPWVHLDFGLFYFIFRTSFLLFFRRVYIHSERASLTTWVAPLLTGSLIMYYHNPARSHQILVWVGLHGILPH